MNIETIIKNFCKCIRNYRSDDAELGIVNKVWNRGMGRLALFHVYRNERIILVNNALANKADGGKLMRLIWMLNEAWNTKTEDWSIREVYYGYPLYYNNSFSIKLLND